MSNDKKFLILEDVDRSTVITTGLYDDKSYEILNKLKENLNSYVANNFHVSKTDNGISISANTISNNSYFKKMTEQQIREYLAELLESSYDEDSYYVSQVLLKENKQLKTESINFCYYYDKPSKLIVVRKKGIKDYFPANIELDESLSEEDKEKESQRIVSEKNKALNLTEKDLEEILKEVY